MIRAYNESNGDRPNPSVRAEEHANHMKLLEAALKGARNQLTEQSRLLGDTQQRVELLVGAQQRMQTLVNAEIKKRKAHAARCTELESEEAAKSIDEMLRAKAKELEPELKRATSTDSALKKDRAEVQKELESARASMAAVDAQRKQTLFELALAEAKKASHEADLVGAQERRKTAEEAAEARRAEMQQKIDDLKAADAKRIELEQMMESVSMAPPPGPASGLGGFSAFKPPPKPPPVPAGLNAAAGGFEL